MTAVPMTVRLDELGDGLGAWEYNNGDEFRGARGGLAPNDGWEARVLRHAQEAGCVATVG